MRFEKKPGLGGFVVAVRRLATEINRNEEVHKIDTTTESDMQST